MREVLKSRGSVGSRVGRPIARIAVLNEFCITDDKQDRITGRDKPAVEATRTQTDISVHTPLCITAQPPAP